MAEHSDDRREYEEQEQTTAAQRREIPRSMLSAAAGVSAVALHRRLARRRAQGVAPALHGGTVARALLADTLNVSAAPEIANTSPTEVANGGFSGLPTAIPYLEEMSRSFGHDFSSVRAYNDHAARHANEKLGADAYAMGDQVAFKSSHPDRALVAHELTHVLQQTQGPAAKATDGEIDTSGEAQADAVENAVRAGRPASSVLGRTERGSSLARRRTLARHGDGFLDNFGMGLSFSKEKFEATAQWKLLEVKDLAVPVGVPFLYALVDASASVKGAVGTEHGIRKSLQLGVEGTLGCGLGGGQRDVAIAYGMSEGTLGGALTLTSQIKSSVDPVCADDRPGGWNLQGKVTGEVGAKFGVKIGPNGILDVAFDLGRTELFTLTGIDLDGGGFHKNKLGFHWGEKIQEVFDEIRQLCKAAKELGAAGLHKVKEVGSAVYNAPGQLLRRFRNVLQR